MGVDNLAHYREVEFFHRGLISQHQPRRPIGDLGAVAGGDFAERAVEYRFEFGQRLHIGIPPQAIVFLVVMAIGVVNGFHFLHPSLVYGIGQALMTANRVLVHGFAADIKAVGQNFSRLSHGQTHHRIGEAF